MRSKYFAADARIVVIPGQQNFELGFICQHALLLPRSAGLGSFTLPESLRALADIEVVSRFWQDAAGILETATSVADGSASHLAILVDERNGIRIVDSVGWTLDALRREYQANTAYAVHRSGNAVVVEGQNADESCTFKKNVAPAVLRSLTSSIPYHLVRTPLLA